MITLEHYVKVALNRFGNCVVDAKLLRQCGINEFIKAVKEELELDIKVEKIEKTYIAKVVK